MPLLGKAEKAQLEELIHARLCERFDESGAGSMLAEGLRVVVTGKGVWLDSGEHADPLAAVPLRTLFTALCYIDAGSSEMPRDALASLAAEAAVSAAAQVNRITGE